MLKDLFSLKMRDISAAIFFLNHLKGSLNFFKVEFTSSVKAVKIWRTFSKEELIAGIFAY